MDKVEEIFYKIAGVQPPKPTSPKPMPQQKPMAPAQNQQATAKPTAQPQMPQTTPQQRLVTPQQPAAQQRPATPQPTASQQRPATPQQGAPANPAQGQTDFAQQSWNAMTPEQQRQIATMPPRIGGLQSGPGYDSGYRDPRDLYSKQISEWQKANPASTPNPSGNIGAADREVYDPNLPNSAYAYKAWKDKHDAWVSDMQASREAWPKIQAALQDTSTDYVEFPEGTFRKDDPKVYELLQRHASMNPVTGTPVLATPAGIAGASQAAVRTAKGVSTYLPKAVQTIVSKTAPYAVKGEKMLDTAGAAVDVYNGIVDSDSIGSAASNVSNNLNNSGVLGAASGLKFPTSVLKNTTKGIRVGGRIYKNEETARNVYNTTTRK